MPLDKSGSYHFNKQRADASDRMGPKPAPMSAKPSDSEAKPESGGDSTTLHDHGDGTFHTDPGGEQHQHIGHALMHMAGKHSTGKHFHAHHDGGHVTTHHNSDGQTEGPSEHGSGDEAAEEMKGVMGDGGESAGMDDDSAHSMHSMPSFSGM